MGDGQTFGLTRRATLGALPALALAGCGRAGAAAGAPLTVWAMSYEGDYSPHLMPSFTAATGIPVEVQSLPWTAAHEKLLTAFAGGSLPDVLMLPNGWVGEFAMIGAIAPLADRSLVADMFPGVLDTVRQRGIDYAVPWSLAPQVQFYRTDILADAGYGAPPTNWADWREMGRRIKRRRPDDYAFLMLLNWWDVFFTFLGQTGVRPLRDHDTRGNFRTPAGRAAFAFYVSLYAEDLAPRVLSTEIADPLASFAQGYFAVYPYGPALLLDLHRRRAIIPPDRWSTARMPGPHGPGPASGVSASLAISTQTRRPAAARALLRHMTSPHSELRFQGMIGNLPAARSAWSSPQLDLPVLRPFAEQVLHPSNGPKIVEWERIRLDTQLVAERVVRGQMTIDQGLAEMDVRADRILTQRRELVDAGRIA